MFYYMYHMKMLPQIVQLVRYALTNMKDFHSTDTVNGKQHQDTVVVYACDPPQMQEEYPDPKAIQTIRMPSNAHLSKKNCNHFPPSIESTK